MKPPEHPTSTNLDLVVIGYTGEQQIRLKLAQAYAGLSGGPTTAACLLCWTGKHQPGFWMPSRSGVEVLRVGLAEAAQRARTFFDA